MPIPIAGAQRPQDGPPRELGPCATHRRPRQNASALAQGSAWRRAGSTAPRINNPILAIGPPGLRPAPKPPHLFDYARRRGPKAAIPTRENKSLTGAKGALDPLSARDPRRFQSLRPLWGQREPWPRHVVLTRRLSGLNADGAWLSTTWRRLSRRSRRNAGSQTRDHGHFRVRFDTDRGPRPLCHMFAHSSIAGVTNKWSFT